MGQTERENSHLWLNCFAQQSRLPQLCTQPLVCTMASVSAAVASWAQEVLDADAEISRLNLQLTAARVRFSYAKRMHRAEVLAKLQAEKSPLPAGEADEVLATPLEAEPPGLSHLCEASSRQRTGSPGVQVAGRPPKKARGAAAPRPAAAAKAPGALLRQPPDTCTACWRRSVGFKQGVAHLYVLPCTKPPPVKGKGVGKARRAQAEAAERARAGGAGAPGGDVRE